MKKILKILIIIAIHIFVSSCNKDDQPINTGRFMKFYGKGLIDYANDLVQTNDGGYLIAGYTQNSNQKRVAYVIKTNSLGDLIWQKTYGENAVFSEFNKVKIFDDGFVFLGTYEDSLPSIKKDMYLVKTDFNGDIIWEQLYGGEENQEGKDFVLMPNGDFMLAGSSTQANNDAEGNQGGVNPIGVKECNLVRVSTEENSILKSFLFGGSNDDEINSIALTDNATRIYCAYTLNIVQNTQNLKLANDNAAIARIEVNPFNSFKLGIGDYLPFGTLGFDRLHKILPSPNNGLIIAGSMNNNDSIALFNLTNRENLALTNFKSPFTSSILEVEDLQGLIIQDIKPTSEGGYIITGKGNNGLALINIDEEGIIIWYRLDADVNGINEGKSVIQTNDGGFAVIGNTGFGVDGDIMLLKVTTEGKL